MKNFFDAAVLEKIGAKLSVLKNIQIPELKNGQILVKIKYTAICGSQMQEIYGGRNNKKYLPHLLGHEATGIIEKIHHNIKNFKRGDRVFLSWISKKEKFRTSYFHPKKKIKINSGEITTFNTYSIVNKSKVFKLNPSINFRDGVYLGCCLPTGAGIVLKNLKNFRNNGNICIYGIGGVGIWSLLTCLYLKKKNITVIESNKKKINKLKKIIKNKNIKYLSSSRYVKNIFEVVFETTGSISALQNSINIINNKGLVIFASHPKRGETIKIDPFELIKGKKIFGSWGGSINFKKDLFILEKILKKNILISRKIFKDIYSLDDINKAIFKIKKGEIFRAIIKI